MNNAIKVKNLNFKYGNQVALEDVNFSYDRKDFFVIIGPNGGGKSTLLKLLLGLLSPTSGEIKIFGDNTIKSAKSIAYVPQNTNITSNFPMMVIDVVLMGKLDNKIFGFYSKKDREEALSSLEKVGIADLAKKRIDELSGGQRQRAFIARALCSKTKVLIMDEPTSSIDADGQEQIFELLQEINKEGIGIIVVSHDLDIAINYATKIAYINKNLFMHNMDELKIKDNIFKNFASKDKHICQVELITENFKCKHD